MSIKLYQFPISHYCEKARWALDYKGLDYQPRNLIPGRHVKTVRKLAPESHVPILDHDGVIVQGSAAIITYLDDSFPDRMLTPGNPQEAEAAMEWEQYLDEEIGVHVRRYVYHSLLDHPNVVVPMLTSGAPWLSRQIFRLLFPKVRQIMRQHMKIDARGAAESFQHMEAALERINSTVAEQPFLVGKEFSRADLTATALLAPLFMSAKYGLDWPPQMPEPLHSDVAKLQERLLWAEAMYIRYR